MASHDELRTTCSKQLNFEPAQTLLRLAEENNLVITDAAFATLLDEQDKLKTLREEFYYPKIKDLPTGELLFTLQEDLVVPGIIDKYKNGVNYTETGVR